MNRKFLAGMVGGLLVSAAWQQPVSPAAPGGIDGLSQGSTAATPPQAVAHHASGGGRYLLIDSIDAQFAFGANQHGNGLASGRFHQTLEFDGQHVEFHGAVTCLSVDSANGRAWIGGVITKNLSEHPAFQAERNEPGRDIWFRVLDSGEGAGTDADRTTFVGFEGDAGFATSADYCAGQPWPDNNERTWGVTAGNIQVR